MSSRDYLLYASIIFVWSTSWLPLKWQVGVVDPEVSILWRFMIAAGICMAIAIFRRTPDCALISKHMGFSWRWDCLFSALISPYFICWPISDLGIAGGCVFHSIPGEYNVDIGYLSHPPKNWTAFCIRTGLMRCRLYFLARITGLGICDNGACFMYCWHFKLLFRQSWSLPIFKSRVSAF